MLIIAPKSSVRRMRVGDICSSAERCGIRAATCSWHEAQYFAYTASPFGCAAGAADRPEAASIQPEIEADQSANRPIRVMRTPESRRVHSYHEPQARARAPRATFP